MFFLMWFTIHCQLELKRQISKLQPYAQSRSLTLLVWAQTGHKYFSAVNSHRGPAPRMGRSLLTEICLVDAVMALMPF